MLTLQENTMLGEIPNGWKSKSLAEMLTEHYPGDWGKEYGLHMVNVLRSTNLTGEGGLDVTDVAIRGLSPRKANMLTPKQGDILLERSGGGPDQPVGRVGLVKDDMPRYAFSNFLHLLRPDGGKVNPRFLGWVLYRINQTGRIVRLEQQTTQMRNLNFRDYLTMPIPYPPLKEQSSIAHILDAVDTAIERTREAVEQARVAKHALVQKAFSEGLYGEQQRKTIIGHIPKSWQVVSVNDVVKNFQYGLSVPMEGRGHMPILRMGNLQDGEVVFSDVKYVSLPETVVGPYVLNRGDVLFNRTNSQEWVGKVAIYRHDSPAVFASYLIRLQIDPTFIDPYYLGHVLGSYPTQCRIKRYATPGVQQVNVNATNLGKVLIPLPIGSDGLVEQQRIAALLEAANQRISSYEPILAAQQALKRSLMHDLLTGKVRVRDAPKAVTS